MASCKTNCNPTKQTNPGNDPVQLIGAGSNYVEISAAAAAPIGNGVCKDGMILVATGGSNKQLLMGSVQPPYFRRVARISTPLIRISNNASL